MLTFYPTVVDLYRDVATVEGASEVADDFNDSFTQGGYFRLFL